MGMVDYAPHDLAAERAVIGSMLIDPDAVLRVRQVGLEPSDCWQMAHRVILEAAYRLADRYEAIDVVTVAAALEQTPDGTGSQLVAIGGFSALAGYVQQTPTSIHAAHYAQVVRRMAQQRRVIQAAGEIAALAHAHEGPVDGLYAEAQRILYAATDAHEGGSHLVGTDMAMMDYIAQLDARADELRADPGAIITTGLAGLDDILGDIAPGYLHAVVARTSVGKTIYMEQVAEHNARRGRRAVFYHLELSHQMMLHRRMARYGGARISALQRGYNGPEVSTAIDETRDWSPNLMLVHCPGWTCEQLIGDILRLAAQGVADLVIVDYLQKLALPAVNSHGANLAQAIGQQVEQLKSVAERAALPIIVGSQVSRGFREGNGGRPSMDDIRNTGELAERANQVVVLHRPNERPMTAAVTEEIEARVEKNTGGRTGECRLRHLLGRFMFAGAAEDDLTGY